jgi:hypothetical protein
LEYVAHQNITRYGSYYLDPNFLESNFQRQIVDKWGVSEEEPKKIHKGEILEEG